MEWISQMDCRICWATRRAVDVEKRWLGDSLQLQFPLFILSKRMKMMDDLPPQVSEVLAL